MNISQFRNQPKLAPLTLLNLEGNTLILSQQTQNLCIVVPPLSGINSTFQVTLYSVGKDTKGADKIVMLRKAGAVTSAEYENISKYELLIRDLKDFAHNSELTIILRIDADFNAKLRPAASSVIRIQVQHKPDAPLQTMAPATNYQRWMTDILPDIENLKLHELAWPGTHNAGVDIAGADSPWDEQWGACQDDSFEWQLNQGARVFDLRIWDRTGQNNKPAHFWFYHSSLTANRDLIHFVSDVAAFLDENPDEILMFDIHETWDSIFDTFDLTAFINIIQPLLGRMIPPTAKDLTLSNIRKLHPGKSIIIAWDAFGDAAKYGFWPVIGHKWIGEDYISADELKDYIDEVMKNPPNGIWSLSAAAYSFWTGPIRLTAEEDCMKAPFVTGARPNIVNVDFFTDVGVVDRCIEYNKNLGSTRKI